MATWRWLGTMLPPGPLSGWLYRIVELVFSERSGGGTVNISQFQFFVLGQMQ